MMTQIYTKKTLNVLLVKGSNMQTSITYEQIQKSLDNIKIPYEMIDIDDVGFSRVFKFNILGLDYYIEWWSNASYLTIGNRYGNTIAFTKIAKAESHPFYKNAIAFCMKGKEDFYDKLYVGLKLLDWQDKIVKGE